MKNPIIMRSVILLLFIILFTASCAMTPARKMVKKGDIGVELSSSVILTDNSYIPSIPNLNMGITYGISDRINTGISVSPGLLFIQGALLVEPFIAARVLEQGPNTPLVNLYSILPVLISFKELELTTFPLIGVLPRYQLGEFGSYLALEALYDNGQNGLVFDFKFNARAGFDLQIHPLLLLGIEMGVNDIGRKSILYGWEAGQPVLKLALLLET